MLQMNEKLNIVRKEKITRFILSILIFQLIEWEMHQLQLWFEPIILTLKNYPSLVSLLKLHYISPPIAYTSWRTRYHFHKSIHDYNLLFSIYKFISHQVLFYLECYLLLSSVCMHHQVILLSLVLLPNNSPLFGFFFPSALVWLN